MLLYALIPQDWLGGDASARGVLFGLRHHLMPGRRYFLGRGISSQRGTGRVAGGLILGAAAVVAAWGLVDIYAISLQTWRDSGVPGWFREQLGLEYRGLSDLPENWVYNPGDERPLRRLVSTFLSPLATAYMLLVAILVAATLAPRLALAAGGDGAARDRPALHVLADDDRCARASGSSRSRYAAPDLVGGRCGRGPRRRRRSSSSAPIRTSRRRRASRPTELEIQRAGGQEDPTSSDPSRPGESSVDSHLDSLRDGIDTIVDHPQGYGLGNAGVTAKRTGAEIKAGESTYTELGVELGLLGMLAFIAWNFALARLLLRREPWLGAAFVAVLALGIQTDVIGVHWLAFVLWTLAGERA